MKFIEYIIEHIDASWNWESISANPNIKWEDINRYSELPWDFKGVSRNPNITLDMVYTIPTAKWSFGNLAKNPNIIGIYTVDRRYLNLIKPHLSLINKYFSENPAVTWEFIQQHPHIDWD